MGKIRPHLVRYWLHSSENVESPETFAEKANEICSIYHGAETVHEAGCYTESVDEMTEIQALEHSIWTNRLCPGRQPAWNFNTSAMEPSA